MISMVKKAFISNLPYLEWMDNATRVAAVEKVSDVIRLHVLAKLCRPSTAF